MTQDYRRALLEVYKLQVGECLTKLKNLKGKDDVFSSNERRLTTIRLSTNVKRVAFIKKNNPDITGPRARQLEMAL